MLVNDRLIRTLFIDAIIFFFQSSEYVRCPRLEGSNSLWTRAYLPHFHKVANGQSKSQKAERQQQTITFQQSGQLPYKLTLLTIFVSPMGLFTESLRRQDSSIL